MTGLKFVAAVCFWQCCVGLLLAQNVVDIQPDTWVGTDALGRSMPTQEVVGPVKQDQRRVVGMFYITWHEDDAFKKGKPPYQGDVSKLLRSDPSVRLDGKHSRWVTNSYHWAEPEMGYFLSKDEYVIRRDLSMLADAGVDVLIMDVTNAVRYWDEWETIFSAMDRMQAEGNRVPKFCFWAFNGPVITVVHELHERIYKQKRYEKHWFYWDGKPLLLYNSSPSVDANRGGIKHPNPKFDKDAKTNPSHRHFGDPAYTEPFFDDYPDEIKEFFTLRTMWWGYYEWAGKRFVGTEDNWSFGYDLGDKRVADLKPEQLLSRHQGVKEQMAVTAAQHAVSKIGKSWSREHGQPPLDELDMPKQAIVPWLSKSVDNPTDYGIYFQQRWDEAIAADPQFLYLNDWNEWTAGKYESPEGELYNFMDRQSNFRFIDQYNAEFNRGIQPMKGRYTDNYYMQMAQNIRRYKGVRAIPESSGLQQIRIDGTFSDWDQVEVTYRDTVGDTVHRDHNGYHGQKYTDTQGRNDIISSQVAVSESDIFFRVTTRDALTPHSDANWMLLLIDADQNHETGWYGYDYIVNSEFVDAKNSTLKRYDNRQKKWETVTDVRFAIEQNNLELRIARESLKLANKNSFTLDFHWCDNPLGLKDPISLCTAGDSAPNRRFNYRFFWMANSSTKHPDDR